jgi:probable HAF family extracellular repeat protein
MLVAAVAVLAPAAPAMAAPVPAAVLSPGAYRAVDLGTLGGGTGAATALNDRGVVVGTSATADGAQHAFRWRAGRMTDLGVLPGHVSSEAVDVNEAGTVAGTSTAADGTRHAFVWQYGRMVDLGTLGGESSWAIGINEKGQVLGLSEPPGRPPHRFLWQGGTMTDLGREDFYESTTGLNDRGDVVGTFNVPPYAYPCSCVGGRLRDGVVTELRSTDGQRVLSDAAAINDHGQVLGHWWSASGWQPVVWRSGTITEMSTLPGAYSTRGLSINNSGAVLGTSLSEDGVSRVVRWHRGVATDLTGHGLTVADRAMDLNDRGDLAGQRSGRPALFLAAR